MKFPGIISFLENYPETIRISQNTGNFLQSGNTVHDVRYGTDASGHEYYSSACEY